MFNPQSDSEIMHAYAALNGSQAQSIHVQFETSTFHLIGLALIGLMDTSLLLEVYNLACSKPMIIPDRKDGGVWGDKLQACIFTSMR